MPFGVCGYPIKVRPVGAESNLQVRVLQKMYIFHGNKNKNIGLKFDVIPNYKNTYLERRKKNYGGEI